MKKCLFAILLSILFIPGVITAASANVSVSAPSSIYVGDSVTVNVTVSSGVSLGSWQYNISYDDSKLSYVSTTANSAQSVVGYAQGGGQSSVTYSWTFKAIASGSASFSGCGSRSDRLGRSSGYLFRGSCGLSGCGSRSDRFGRSSGYLFRGSCCLSGCGSRSDRFRRSCGCFCRGGCGLSGCGSRSDRLGRSSGCFCRGSSSPADRPCGLRGADHG